MESRHALHGMKQEKTEHRLHMYNSALGGDQVFHTRTHLLRRLGHSPSAEEALERRFRVITTAHQEQTWDLISVTMLEGWYFTLGLSCMEALSSAYLQESQALDLLFKPRQAEQPQLPQPPAYKYRSYSPGRNVSVRRSISLRQELTRCGTCSPITHSGSKPHPNS